jgi:hypothetical protein
MRNENGFGLVSFLALLPVILAAAAVILSSTVLLKADAKAKHQCRTELLNAQNSVSNKLERLIAMNKGAKALRIERRAAEAAVVAAAGVPVALAAAMAALDLVIAEQTAYAAIQNALIVAARLESELSPLQVSMGVQGSFSSVSLFRRPDVIGSRLKTGSFPLDASPQESPTPDYEPTTDFTREQTMSVTLEFLIAPLFPNWVRTLVTMDDLSLKTTCSASIEKGDRRWYAVLRPDNS